MSVNQPRSLATPRRVPGWLGPSALLLVTAFGIGAVLWGYFNPPDIRISQFDAGPVSNFAIRKVTAYPEQNIYIVGLDDGRLRALDGRNQASRCSVRWLPDDPRGGVRNPGGVAGVFEDPCNGALWSMLGDAISGSDVPLRVPVIDYRPGEDGRALHAWVEVINPGKP